MKCSAACIYREIPNNRLKAIIFITYTDNGELFRQGERIKFCCAVQITSTKLLIPQYISMKENAALCEFQNENGD